MQLGATFFSLRGAITGLSFLIICLLGGFSAQAQWMLINQSGGTPDSTAVLELRDTTKGFLPPRLANTQMDSIQGPAEGLMVYNTDSSTYYYFDGSSWIAMAAGNGAESGTQNTFGARIANNGTATITSQTTSFIQSVTRTGLGLVQSDFCFRFISSGTCNYYVE